MNMDTQGHGDIHVLVISPFYERNPQSLFSNLNQEFKSKLTVYCVKPVPRRQNSMVDYEKLLKKYREIIQKEKIHVLYSNKHTGSFVHAILASEYPHLKGPSTESIFLCNHKYYTSLYIDSSRSSAVPYVIVNLNNDVYDSAYSVLQVLGSPGIIRPCIGSGNSIYAFFNRDHLIKSLQKCKKDLNIIIDIHAWLYGKFVDKKKYPLALEPLVIIHRYVDYRTCGGTDHWKNIGVEACVVNKKIVRWGLVDTIKLPYSAQIPSNSFPGCEIPARLVPEDCQEKIWEAFEKDIINLIHYGFDNSFVHAEYMIKGNEIHLVTMNGRVDVETTDQYVSVLHHGNNVKAAIEVAMGTVPREPSLNGKYSVSYCMVVGKAGKANELINFEKVSKSNGVLLRYLPGQDVIIEAAKDFAVIGFITVTGHDFPDCMHQISEIRGNILKLPDIVPMVM